MARVVTGDAVTPLLAFFVVLGTGTAIYLLNKDDPEPRPQITEVEVLEIAPALPAISLLPDSVPDRADESEDAGASTSLLEGFDWHDDRERKRRFAESLERTMQEVDGLGVYVEPPTKPDKKENR